MVQGYTYGLSSEDGTHFSVVIVNQTSSSIFTQCYFSMWSTTIFLFLLCLTQYFYCSMLSTTTFLMEYKVYHNIPTVACGFKHSIRSTTVFLLWYTFFQKVPSVVYGLLQCFYFSMRSKTMCGLPECFWCSDLSNLFKELKYNTK